MLPYTSNSDPPLCSALQVKRHFAGPVLPSDIPLFSSFTGLWLWLAPSSHTPHCQYHWGEEKRRDQGVRQGAVSGLSRYQVHEMADARTTGLHPKQHQLTLCCGQAPQVLFSAGSHTLKVKAPATGGIPHYFSWWLYPFSFFLCLLDLMMHTSYLKSLFM